MSHSSSSQAPLVIDDNEPKHAPSTLATTSASNSQVLPPPRFRNRIACVEVNTLTFEQGFEEQWVEGGSSIGKTNSGPLFILLINFKLTSHPLFSMYGARLLVYYAVMYVYSYM